MRARSFLKGLMPVVLNHRSVTLMSSFVELGTFLCFFTSCRTVAIYLGRVLPSPLVGFVAVAYDDKWFGCFTRLDKWVWFSTDSASARTVSCNRLV